MLSLSAGRLVVEDKIVEELTEKKSNSGSQISSFDNVKEELPEDEKSEFWEWGVLLYSIGLPFVWVSMIIFYAMPNM